MNKGVDKSVKKFVLRYNRFGSEDERGYDTLMQAMAKAWRDLEYNEARPIRITDGDRVYDSEAMWAYWEEHNWENQWDVYNDLNKERRGESETGPRQTGQEAEEAERGHEPGGQWA